MIQFTQAMQAVRQRVIEMSRGQGCCDGDAVQRACRELNISLTPAEMATVERSADFDLDTTPWS